MNKNQEAYKSMAFKTIGEMHIHSTVWKTNKVISATVLEIENVLTEIDKTNARQNISTKGITKQKSEFRNKIDNTTDIVLGIFRSYAKTIGNEDLYANSDKTITEIKRILDTEILVLANFVYDYSSNNKDVLKDYGISDQLIKEYQSNIKGYKEYLTKPQQIKAEKATATAELKELFKKLNQQLNDYLDNHMMQYKEKEPKFYSDYENARIIYDAPTIALSIKGKVTEGGDAEVEIIEYVTVIVKFKAGTDWKEMRATTTAKGNYQFKGIPEGKCTITFEKNYYETLVVESEVHHGKFTKVDVVMKKK